MQYSTLKSLVVIAFFMVGATVAQAQNCIWAKGAGGTNYDCAQAVATDAAGSVYVTGYYQSATIAFGATVLTNTNSGTRDMYLVKYDSAGSVVWAVGAGGTGDEYANSVAVDDSGNSYVIGSYNSATFIVGTTTLTNAGGYDIFLVKYNAAGIVVWAKGIGDTIDDEGRYVAVDAMGNVYITGGFTSSTLMFGSVVLTNMVANVSDIFLAKYSPTGNVIWAKRAGGVGYDDAHALAIANTGNVYVVGYFYSPTFSFGATTLTNAGQDDMYIAKYDTMGNALWARSAGDTGYEYASGIAIDGFGDLVVTGGYNSHNISFGGTTLTNLGNYDMYIAKYDTGGSVVWAKSAGGTDVERPNAITIDGAGNSYVAGYFYSADMIIGTTTLANSGVNGDVFVIKYDGSGSMIWAKGVGGSVDDRANGAAVDAFNNVYVAGYYESTTINFGTTTLTNAGSNADMFVVKYNTTTLGVAELETKGKGIMVYPNPADGVINIVFDAKLHDCITVYDCFGRVVNTTILNGTEKTIQVDISNFIEGVYYLRSAGEVVGFVVGRR